MNMKPGFISREGNRIYFIEPKGKDAMFERWRVTLYYAPNLAETQFFPSQAEYDAFLARHQPLTYSTYQDFKQFSNRQKGI
jgi:hypothetical protein